MNDLPLGPTPQPVRARTDLWASTTADGSLLLMRKGGLGGPTDTGVHLDGKLAELARILLELDPTRGERARQLNDVDAEPAPDAPKGRRTR